MRVHVGVREHACAREVLLDVGLVRQVRGDLLEHDVVQREALAQLPHHLELVEHDYLGMLVMVGANKKRFAPSVQAIKERYYQKFRGKSGESLDESLDE